MTNYSLKFGTSEVAKMLQVERHTVKNWAYRFSDYLSPKANPQKGEVREFNLNDVRVFSYIFMYWEEEPDLESIRYGLNSNSHYEYPYDQFILEAVPLFREMPENIDETWKGVVFGGEFELGDIFAIATSYKNAGDKLVDLAYESNEERELFCPVIYNYRHATELYLKAFISEQKSHDLLSLLKRLKILIRTEFNAITPVWFDNVIKSFNDFDPYGTSFRYGDLSIGENMYADMIHVKKLMTMMAEAFNTIKEKYIKKSC